MIITKEYLRKNPTHIFVFGDNLLRKGLGGAAVLRNEPNTYGFLTKKYPNNSNSSFYTPFEYRKIFDDEMRHLIEIIKDNPGETFLISKLGAGLANRHRIWERVICPGLHILKHYNNVKFLF